MSGQCSTLHSHRPHAMPHRGRNGRQHERHNKRCQRTRCGPHLHSVCLLLCTENIATRDAVPQREHMLRRDALNRRRTPLQRAWPECCWQNCYSPGCNFRRAASAARSYGASLSHQTARATVAQSGSVVCSEASIRLQRRLVDVPTAGALSARRAPPRQSDSGSAQLSHSQGFAE